MQIWCLTERQQRDAEKQFEAGMEAGQGLVFEYGRMSVSLFELYMRFAIIFFYANAKFGKTCE